MKNALEFFVGTGHSSNKEALIALYNKVISSDFVHKIAETFATRILLIAIGLVTSVIVVRILGPEGRGLYAVAVAVMAIGVQFGNLGLHASNTYSIAQDRSLLPALTSNTLFISFVFGGLGAFLAWIFFLLWPSLAPVQGTLLILALLWIPFSLAYMLLQNLLLGLYEVRTYNKIELATKIFTVILIGTVIILKMVTVQTIFITGLITSVIGFGWILWKLSSYFERLPYPSFSLFKNNIRYGFKAYMAAFFAFMVIRIDLLMVNSIQGAEQAGYYSIAVKIADMVYMLPVIIGTILFPKLSALSNDSEKWQLAKIAALLTGLIMTAGAVVAILLAKPMIWLLYGEPFLPAVPAFIWLMPAVVLISINTIYMNYFASTGMPMITVYSPAMATVLNIIANAILIPRLGIIGASISSVASYGLMLMTSITYIRYTRKEKLLVEVL